ncbi:serine/threonine-protein phosphatase, partial [Mycolicibacterium setense]|uniref:serine/threonine-protein phosphatase n=1 Tax=Mycolicibacterium setense TaxID=431269 RepID=UPI0021F30868
AGAGAMSYNCAGHPYPLVVSPNASPVFLKSGRRPPVATRGTDSTDVTARADLPAGSLIIFYTDGLMERAGGDSRRRLCPAGGCGGGLLRHAGGGGVRRTPAPDVPGRGLPR